MVTRETGNDMTGEPVFKRSNERSPVGMTHGVHYRGQFTCQLCACAVSGVKSRAKRVELLRHLHVCGSLYLRGVKRYGTKQGRCLVPRKARRSNLCSSSLCRFPHSSHPPFSTLPQIDLSMACDYYHDQSTLKIPPHPPLLSECVYSSAA